MATAELDEAGRYRDAVADRVNESEWAGRLSITIGQQVARLRRLRGLSARELAEACTALGHPISRTAVSNVEVGRRAAISVTDLLALARALDAPPESLLIPAGRQETVEILPEVDVRIEEALAWFEGEGPLTVQGRLHTPAGLLAQEMPSAPRLRFTLHRRHLRMLADYEVTRQKLADLRSAAGEVQGVAGYYADVESLEHELATLRALLRATRTRMRDLGEVLPSLPQDLRILVDDSSPEVTR